MIPFWVCMGNACQKSRGASALSAGEGCHEEQLVAGWGGAWENSRMNGNLIWTSLCMRILYIYIYYIYIYVWKMLNGHVLLQFSCAYAISGSHDSDAHLSSLRSLSRRDSYEQSQGVQTITGKTIQHHHPSQFEALKYHPQLSFLGVWMGSICTWVWSKHFWLPSVSVERVAGVLFPRYVRHDIPTRHT